MSHANHLPEKIPKSPNPLASLKFIELLETLNLGSNH